MNNRDFDKFIREQLGKLEADFDGQHWEMMEHRLNTEPAPEGGMRQPDELDELVKNKLLGIEAAFDENHWNLMDQKLDAELLSPEMEDIYLDGIAYDNLFDLNAPYNPAHWTLMSKRLDEAFSLRHKIVKYKIAEVAIMLLAIFTLLPYLPLSKQNKTPKQPVAVQQQLLPSMSSGDKALPSAPSNATAQNSESTTADAALLKDAGNSLQSATAPLATAETQRQTNGNSPQQASINSVVPPSNADGTVANSRPAATDAIALLTTIAKRPTPLLESSQLASLPGLQIVQQSLLTETIDSRYKLLKGKGRRMPAGLMHLLPGKKKRIRLGMFGALDMNYVMSTSSPNFSVPSYDQFFAGYGGGLSIGIGGEKWEFNFAAIYASTYYVPRKVNVDLRSGDFLGGWYGTGLAAARIEMLKVPVNVHRSLGKIGKIQFSALMGAAANIALYGNYETRVVSVGGNPDNPLPAAFGEDIDNDIPDWDGALEKGRLGSNFYLTANLGLRLERDLTARWSLFMQPNYQHRVLSTGFGPTNDRINTLSAYLGLRVNLK